MSGGVLRLIASAAYVEQELAAEFGQIPPAFLPIGVSRLYEAQITQLGADSPIYLTIPEDFTPQSWDQQKLAELGVILVPVPIGLRLGESIVYALNYIAAPAGVIQLLHGDTLIEDIPASEGDLIAVNYGDDGYSWAAAELDEDGTIRSFDVLAAGTRHHADRPVVCGYFAFGSSALLVRAITRARGDFIGGLNVYIRDRKTRAVSVRCWRDFGHIQTYFRSRRSIITARAFNALQIDACTVRKSSRDHQKMHAEATWLGNLPAAVKPYSARLLEFGDENDIAFYSTEYQYAPTLSELFVFSSIGRSTWRTILQSCQDFLSACAASKGRGSGDAVLQQLACDKTLARLERYARDTGFDIERPTQLDGRPMPSLLNIADTAGRTIELCSGRAETLMHGDFCFSNILYNSRARRITVIDPRGYVQQGIPSLYGDIRYDLAKLSHSINGYYDLILAGRYTLQWDGRQSFAIGFETDAHNSWLSQTFNEIEVDGIRADSQTVQAITVGLFLSMLPLHADRPDRQAALIANGLRLYSRLVGS
jgi:hypothetical protein